jgi:hypothetical protein
MHQYNSIAVLTPSTQDNIYRAVIEILLKLPVLIVDPDNSSIEKSPTITIYCHCERFQKFSPDSWNIGIGDTTLNHSQLDFYLTDVDLSVRQKDILAEYITTILNHSVDLPNKIRSVDLQMSVLERNIFYLIPMYSKVDICQILKISKGDLENIIRRLKRKYSCDFPGLSSYSFYWMPPVPTLQNQRGRPKVIDSKTISQIHRKLNGSNPSRSNLERECQKRGYQPSKATLYRYLQDFQNNRETSNA